MKNSKHLLQHLMLVLALAVLAPGQASAADYQELDSIVAVVNDDVVLQSELDIKMLEVQAQLATARAQMHAHTTLASGQAGSSGSGTYGGAPVTSPAAPPPPPPPTPVGS